MPTPHNAPYKKAQREGRAAVRNRGKVLWRSNVITKDLLGIPVTQILQGTYERAVHGELK